MKNTEKVTVTRLDGLRVEAQARTHTITFDGPKTAEGGNTAPLPGETLLACLGACQQMVATSLAKKMNIDLKGIHSEIEGDTQPEGPPAFTEIRFHMYFDSDADQKTLDRLADLVEKNCPIEQTLLNGVKVVRTGASKK
ncbi:MAG: OsmC family protein [Christensenellaceae bacterium]|jgi:putative redox protein